MRCCDRRATYTIHFGLLLTLMTYKWQSKPLGGVDPNTHVYLWRVNYKIHIRTKRVLFGQSAVIGIKVSNSNYFSLLVWGFGFCVVLLFHVCQYDKNLYYWHEFWPETVICYHFLILAWYIYIVKFYSSFHDGFFIYMSFFYLPCFGYLVFLLRINCELTTNLC